MTMTRDALSRRTSTLAVLVAAAVLLFLGACAETKPKPVEGQKKLAEEPATVKSEADDEAVRPPPSGFQHSVISDHCAAIHQWRVRAPVSERYAVRKFPGEPVRSMSSITGLRTPKSLRAWIRFL